MTLTIRRMLWPAMLFAVPLAAQGHSTSPQVSVGGLFVTRYQYQLTDTANHANAFDITRAYVNLTVAFPGGLATRVTADLFTAGDSSRAYRIKYAYAAYTPGTSPLTFKLGMIQTPWLEWEEALWEYRMQGPMAMDRAGYVTASDFGAGVDGMWRSDRINAQIALVNGEGYAKGVGDQRKDLMARTSVRLLDTSDSGRVGGLRVSACGQYGKPTGGGGNHPRHSDRTAHCALERARLQRLRRVQDPALESGAGSDPLPGPVPDDVHLLTREGLAPPNSHPIMRKLKPAVGTSDDPVSDG